jgi:prophage regulatory protein
MTTANVCDSQEHQSPANCASQRDVIDAESSIVASPIFSDSQIPLRILRLPDVMARVGLCRASIYQGIAKGWFPKPIPLGQRARGWVESEISAWLAARIQARQISPSQKRG